MPKLTGTSTVRMDGLSLRMKDAEIDLGGVVRDAAYADGKYQGFTEEPQAATVKGTLMHGSDTDLFKVRDAVSVTITFVTDTGKTYTVRDAACAKPPVLKTKGESDVEFIGPPAF